METVSRSGELCQEESWDLESVLAFASACLWVFMGLWLALVLLAFGIRAGGGYLFLVIPVCFVGFVCCVRVDYN
jgi:hypothetical protein